MIQRLLQEIGEDKHQNLTTTSFKFKEDLWNFFQNFNNSIAVEFGTHKGQTTRILSHLFKKVYTINNNDNESAKLLNKDRSNIVYQNFDLYSSSILPIDDVISVFLVDAGHEYEHVISDMNRIFNMNCSDVCYIIFDDYGCNVHKHTVKRAVDEALHHGYLTMIQPVGHATGYNFGNGGKSNEIDRILESSEGLITKINWT